jgi:hypothetical protein
MNLENRVAALEKNSKGPTTMEYIIVFGSDRDGSPKHCRLTPHGLVDLTDEEVARLKADDSQADAAS